MLIGKEPSPGVLQIEHSDDFAFVNQGYNQFRTGLRICLYIARIFCDIGDQHGFFAVRCIAHQPAAERNVILQMNVLVEAKREAVLQLLAGRVQQQNAEHLVINQTADKFSNASEEFIEVQNGRQFTGDFVEQQQNARLLGCAGVQLRVLDAGGHARSHQREQALMLRGERARLTGFDIDDTDHPVFRDQRNG